MYRVLGCLTEAHDWLLVAVAACLAVLTGFSVFMALRRARDSQGSRAIAWTIAASFIAGFGVFATHFVAMLAYRPGYPVGYDAGLTLLSLAIGVVVPGLGFSVWIFSKRAIAPWIIGSILIGGGIAALHYTGMRGLEIAAQPQWDTDLVIASIVMAIGFNLLAGFCSRRRSGRQQDSGIGLVVGPLAFVLSVVSLHFTGMGAVTFVPDPRLMGPLEHTQTAWLVVLTVLAGGTAIALGFAAAFADRLFHEYDGRMRQRQSALADAAFEALVIHRQGVIMDVNAKMGELTGLAVEELSGRDLRSFLETQDGPLPLDDGSFDQVQFLAHDIAFPVELCTRRMSGHRQDMFVTAIRDLREREAHRLKIEELSTKDPVTGFKRRELFIERVNAYLEEAKTRDEQCAVVRISIQRIREMYEWAGFEAGDRMLAQIAERIRTILPEEAMAARLSGEDLAVMLPGQGEDDVITRTLMDMFERVNRPLSQGKRVVEPELLYGVSVYPSDGGDAETLLSNAAAALEIGGEDRIRFHHPALNEKRRARLETELGLAQAIREGQLSLVYQPQSCLKTGRILGVETLVRWSRDGAAISPSEFIPVAEETGLIRPLGRFVLKQAARETAHWPDNLVISVNLSPAQFTDPELVAMLEGMIESGEIKPSRFKLEITEGAVIDDAERSTALMNTLKQMGFQLSLDDFGTGYSSLSYLRNYPFDQVKIDRAFVHDVDRDASKARLLKAIVELGQALELDTLAEGAETLSELDHLRQAGCGSIQGYILSKPFPVEEMEGFMSRYLAMLARGGLGAKPQLNVVSDADDRKSGLNT